MSSRRDAAGFLELSSQISSGGVYWVSKWVSYHGADVKRGVIQLGCILQQKKCKLQVEDLEQLDLVCVV